MLTVKACGGLGWDVVDDDDLWMLMDIFVFVVSLQVAESKYRSVVSAHNSAQHSFTKYMFMFV